MGWFTKEVKTLGKEFARQGSILLFGKAPKRRNHNHYKHRRRTGAEKQYNKAQRWAKSNGFI